MELRHLRYFLAVADERHFGRAAERLHIAQPPLSRQIRALEAELGVDLFTRTTRRVELTPAGERLLDRANRVLNEVKDAAEDCRRAARGEAGHLSLGFGGSISYGLLPVVANALRAGLPGVELELHGEMFTPAQVAGLLDGSLDLALLRPPVRERRLQVQTMRSEPLIVAVGSGHRLAELDEVPLKELAGEPFVTYPSQFRSVVHDAVEEACAEQGFLPRVAVEVSETSTLVCFVAAGVGVALVPASVAVLALPGIVYRPLAGLAPRVELAVAWRRDDESPLLARVLEIVHQAGTVAGTEPPILQRSRS
jgi:DNA-binding transcriptional LysR family regulator